MNPNPRTLRTLCASALGGVALLFGGAWAGAAEHPHAPAAAPAKTAAPALDADVYPLSTCVVTGQKLGAMGDPVVYQHQGREIRFCCKGCIEKFESDPAGYLKLVDAEIVKQQLPHYPLATCVITGEKLGSMGQPVDYVHKNRLVRFCCQGCVAQFQKAPLKHIAALNKAVLEKQSVAYPLDTCVVMGTKLGKMGDTIDYVSGNRLVRLCCKGCIAAFQKEPAKYLEKLDAALKAKQGAAPKPTR